MVWSLLAFPESAVAATGGNIRWFLVSILLFVPLGGQVWMRVLEAVFFGATLVCAVGAAGSLGSAVEAGHPFVTWVFSTLPIDLDANR